MKPILNAQFALPADNFVLAVPVGEWPVEQSLGGGKRRKLVQVVDGEAVEAMANRFAAAAAAEDFAGVLVDYDHGSLDTEKSSEAAGWAMEAEARSDGLYVRNRWTDRGEAAVLGGRFRFLSPVFAPEDVVELGGNRVRPVRLERLALTNDPNMKKLPLSNRAAGAHETGSDRGKEVRMKDQIAPVLGLAADAADEAVVEAVKHLANRAATAEGRVAELERAELERSVDADLEEFADVIANRDDARTQLLANRDGARKLLGSLRKAPDRARLPNRQDGTVPATDPGAKPEGAARAAAIRNRAAEIGRQQGLPFDMAWRAAEKELAAE